MMRLVAAAFSVSLVVGAAWAQTADVLADYVVAAVNGEAITASALAMAMRVENADTADANARRRVLDSLIDQRLFLQKARNFTFVTDERVSEHLERLQGTFPSRQQFIDDLARRGMTLDDAREQIRDSLMLVQLELRNFRPQITEVSPTDVEAYYVAHPEEFSVPARFRLAQFTVEFDGETSLESDAQRKAVALRERIASGELTPEALAEQVNGDLAIRVVLDSGLKLASDLPAALGDAVAELPVSGVTAPLRVPGGFLVAVLRERRDASRQPLADVRAAIIAKLELERVRVVMDGWLRDERARADIRLMESTVASRQTAPTQDGS